MKKTDLLYGSCWKRNFRPKESKNRKRRLDSAIWWMKNRSKETITSIEVLDKGIEKLFFFLNCWIAIARILVKNIYNSEWQQSPLNLYVIKVTNAAPSKCFSSIQVSDSCEILHA